MQFFKELQRRNVFRVAIGYIVSCWLLAQVYLLQGKYDQARARLTELGELLDAEKDESVAMSFFDEPKCRNG